MDFQFFSVYLCNLVVTPNGHDHEQVTAWIVVRSKDGLDAPLNMTHCYLRAMSPIHIKYLANMGVRSSMSVSIVAFGHLWGLVACHSYGPNGMRMSFTDRQMLRLTSDSISRNGFLPASCSIQSRVAGTNNHKVISSRTQTTCLSYSTPILACLSSARVPRSSDQTSMGRRSSSLHSHLQ